MPSGVRLVSFLAAASLIFGACATGNTSSSGSPSASGGSPTTASAGASPGATASGVAGDSGSPAATPPLTGGSASAGPASLNARGKLSAFGVSYKTGDDMAKGRIDLFKQRYPAVSLTFSESSFDSQQFLAALQGSGAPDVVRIPRDELGSYVARGVLAPLDDCLSKAGVSMSAYRDAAVKQVTIGGHVYGMPEFFWVTNWLVDNDLFAQAGLDPTSWNVSNWDQIAAANQALLTKTKAKVGIDPKVWDTGDRFPLWVAAAGGQMLSDDGKTAMLDSQPVIDALTFTKSLIDAQGGLVKFKDRIGQTGDFFGKQNEFVGDLEGAFPMQQWYLNVLATNSPNTKFTAIPFKTRDGKPITYAEGDALAIVKSTTNMDAACAFVTTMTGKDAWLAAAKLRADNAAKANQIETGSSTGNKDADQAIFASDVNAMSNPTFKAALDAFNGTLDSSFAMPSTPAAEEFKQAWIDGVTKALDGAADPKAAMTSAQQEAQDAIDSAPAP